MDPNLEKRCREILEEIEKDYDTTIVEDDAEVQVLAMTAGRFHVLHDGALERNLMVSSVEEFASGRHRFFFCNPGPGGLSWFYAETNNPFLVAALLEYLAVNCEGVKTERGPDYGNYSGN